MMISIKAQSCTRYHVKEEAEHIARLLRRDEEGNVEYKVEQRGQGWFIVAYEQGAELGPL